MSERYQDWCRDARLPPIAFQHFSQLAKEEIEIAFGLKLRHDFLVKTESPGEWRGLVLLEDEMRPSRP